MQKKKAGKKITIYEKIPVQMELSAPPTAYKNNKLEKACCLIICPTNTWGGVEKNVRLRALHLGQRGYKVIVVLLNNEFSDKFKGLENVKVESVNQRGGDLNLLVVKRYCKIIKRHKPQIVFSALKKDWFLVSLSAYLCNVPRIILYLGIKRKIRNSFKYRTVFNKFKANVLVNSNSLKNDLIEGDDFLSSKNVFRIYNGFEIPTDNVKPIDLRAQFNLAENIYLIGIAGRFSEQKGFDLIPDILKKLPENIHIVHAGGGKENDIQTKLMESEYASRIHFLGYQADIIPFMKAIDLFLLPSRWEGMANVLNEAMSVGKPIISTQVSGSDELLLNGQNGILCPIEDVDCMVESITAIYKGEINFDSEKQIERIRKSFSLPKMISQTEHLFFGDLQNFKETP